METRLYLLGPPKLEISSQILHNLGSRKAVALLGYLVQQRTPVDRSYLADLLWPDNDEKHGRSNLSRELYRLSTYLPACFESDYHTIQFKPTDAISVDIWTWTEQVQTVNELPSLSALLFAQKAWLTDSVPGEEQSRALSLWSQTNGMTRLTHAVELYRGDFMDRFHLSDCLKFEYWLQDQQTYWQQQFARLLEELIAYHLLEAKIDLARPYLNRWLNLQPWQERAHQLMMVSLVLQGDRNAALVQYKTACETLAEELGVEPSAGTKLLYEQIKMSTACREVRSSISPVLPAFLQKETLEVAPATSSVCVARTRELATLEENLLSVQAGQGRILFVVGEAGRGKTTLLEEFIRQAQTNNSELLAASGFCNAQSGIGDPYLPFREALTMLTGEVEAKWASGLMTTLQAHRLWTGMSITIPTLVGHGPDLIGNFVSAQTLQARAATFAPTEAVWFQQLIAQAHQSELEQTHIFVQYTATLKAIAKRRSVVLILEDLHWADTSSISLLFHLSRQLGDSRIFILGTYRPSEVTVGWEEKRHPLANIVGELKRQYGDIWLDLGDQTPQEGREFIDAYLDTQPNRLSNAFRERLFLHTRGHALFTIELLREMQDRGGLRQDDGYWIEGESINWQSLPPRVEGVIEQRIERLDRNLQQTLTVASVEGERFTAEVVAHVQRTEERMLVQQLSGELAKRHRLVVTEGIVRAGLQRLSLYRFRHNLFQHYLYYRLDGIERVYLHEIIGQTLEGLYGGQAGQIAGQLARHFDIAGLSAKAIDYLFQAGVQAYQLAAHEDALIYFNRALELTSIEDETKRYTILLAREKVYHLQGLRQAQHADLVTLSALAERLMDDHQRAEVALRQANYAEAIGDYAQATAAIQKALRLAQMVKDVPLEAITRELSGRVLWRQGEYESARIQLAQALILAQSSGLPQVEADCLRNLGIVFDLSGNIAAGKAYYEQALQIYRKINHRHGESQALNNLGVVVREEGEYLQALEHFKQSLHLRRQIGDRRGEGQTLQNLGWIYAVVGDYPTARDYYEQALSNSREIDNRWDESLVLGNFALMYHQQGDHITARKYCQQAILIAEELGARATQGYALMYLGHVLVGLEDLEGGEKVYQQVSDLLRELGEMTLIIEAIAGLARIFLAKKDLPRAKSHIEKILSHLEAGTLAGTEEPFRIFLTCYRVLEAAGDTRARKILHDAIQQLQAQATKISDETMRYSFVQNVAAHRELINEWQQKQSPGSFC